MEGWKIQRDRTKCEEPGCTLLTSKEYFAVLELPECIRRDLCATCFHRLDRDEGGENAPIFWKCRRREAGSKEPVLDLVALRMLFDRLGGVEDEKAQGLRYFVSLLLLRKRVLKMVDPQNREQEQADLVVVDPKVAGMAPVCLVAPELDSERLENLEAELIEALGDGESAEDGEVGVDAPAAASGDAVSSDAISSDAAASEADAAPE